MFPLFKIFLDFKSVFHRQCEIKELAKASSKITQLKLSSGD
jgi:hypothetical protein